jgi:hypothetical protein
MLSPGTQSPEPRSHWFGAVAAPGRLQAPPGHDETTVHGAPLFAPPLQRSPPQIPPAGQSALTAHACAAALLQVSH